MGLCSYLLIGFWHERVAAGRAAIKAFLVNKVSDIFLLLAIALMYILFETVSFGTIFALVPYLPTPVTELVGLLVVVGGVGKSAQLGLHT